MKADDPEFWKQILRKPIQNDPDFWNRLMEFRLYASPIELLAIHGFLLLALRHPGTKDHELRSSIIRLVKHMGEQLVMQGSLTTDALREIQGTEVEEGP